MCPTGFACNATGTGCTLNPASRWQVTAISGTVSRTSRSGGGWDLDGSPPDPILYLTIGGTEIGTNVAADTYTPRWTRGAFPPTTASELLAGIRILYNDDDFGPDDNICLPGTWGFTADEFVAGGVTFTCNPYGTFTLRLTAVP